MPDGSSLTGDNGGKPRVSLIITAKNLERYIDAALWSARRQTLREIEILVIDDGSVDGTCARIIEHAADDARIRVLEGPGRGPAAARNIGLRAAQGDWIAILDGDDIMHPRRLELLLIAAVAEDADILADNQILFFEDGSPSTFLLEGEAWQRRRYIALGEYIRANIMFSNGAPLGYLKPLIRRNLLGDGGVFYDESLRIGEDYDLVARLLHAGAAFAYVPGAFYFYRRHQRSISHRLGTADIASLLAAANRFHPKLFSVPEWRAASEERRAALIRVGRFSRCVDSLKARSFGAAAVNLALHPAIWPLLFNAARGGIERRLRERAKARQPQAAENLLRKRFALLLDGAMPRPGALVGHLEALGWQGKVIAGVTPHGRLTADFVSPVLLELVQARDSQLVFYDDARLRDLLPYLLSPDARLVHILAQTGASPGELQPVEEALAPLQISLTDLADPESLARRLAQVA